MNIFYLDEAPHLAAEMHCDKHVVKMIVETAQLLSTAHHVCGSPHTDSVYRKTHENHPCAVWARSAPAHYEWLYQLLEELIAQYKSRYGKPEHKTERLLEVLAYNPVDGDERGWTPPPQCMPTDYQTEDTCEAYQRYYQNDKAYMAKWRAGNQPSWWSNVTVCNK